MESWQAEVDFTKEQLVNLKQRHESINVIREGSDNKNEEDELQGEKTNEKENHAETTHAIQPEQELESQIKPSHTKVHFQNLIGQESWGILRNPLLKFLKLSLRVLQAFSKNP